MKCERYLGVHCIDGSCPILLAEQFWKYDYEGPHSCEECWVYDGCKGCAWEDTSVCIKYKNTEGCGDIELD